MDKIQDFLKELRARFSSPFFSSFVLAWLIINWKIPIALLFYKLPEWQKEEHSTYISMIQQSVTSYKGIIAPLIAAVCYTLIAPILKNSIRALHAYLDTKGTNWSLTASKSGNISIDRYMQLLDSHTQREANLLKLYNEESKYLKINDELHKNIDDFRNKFENMSANYDHLRSHSEIKSYNGNWELTYADADGRQKSELVSIQMGDICATDREGKFLFKITRIGYVADTTELMLVIEDRRSSMPKPFFVVLYSPGVERAIFINREANQIITRIARATFSKIE